MPSTTKYPMRLGAWHHDVPCDPNSLAGTLACLVPEGMPMTALRYILVVLLVTVPVVIELASRIAPAVEHFRAANAYFEVQGEVLHKYNAIRKEADEEHARLQEAIDKKNRELAIANENLRKAIAARDVAKKAADAAGESSDDLKRILQRVYERSQFAVRLGAIQSVNVDTSTVVVSIDASIKKGSTPRKGLTYAIKRSDVMLTQATCLSIDESSCVMQPVNEGAVEAIRVGDIVYSKD